MHGFEQWEKCVGRECSQARDASENGLILAKTIALSGLVVIPIAMGGDT
jgi:hypothetical protein